MTKYKYIQIVHQGLDYITIKKGNEYYDITGSAIHIIKTLLKKINSST